MWRRVACLLVLVWLFAPAATARAQSGLYVPFPSGPPSNQAKRYLKRLGPSGRTAAESLSTRQIKAGAFLGGMGPAVERPATRRAGGGPKDAPPWPAQLLFLVLPLAAVVVVATRN